MGHSGQRYYCSACKEKKKESPLHHDYVQSRLTVQIYNRYHRRNGATPSDIGLLINSFEAYLFRQEFLGNKIRAPVVAFLDLKPLSAVEHTSSCSPLEIYGRTGGLSCSTTQFKHIQCRRTAKKTLTRKMNFASWEYSIVVTLLQGLLQQELKRSDASIKFNL